MIKKKKKIQYPFYSNSCALMPDEPHLIVSFLTVSYKPQSLDLPVGLLPDMGYICTCRGIGYGV